VCGVGSAYQQPVQLDKRCQFHARRAHDHSTANQRIKHPTGNRDRDAFRPQDRKKLARRSMFHPSYVNPATEIGVPSVMDFQLLADVGRMNGQ
jgi:hypothetical protein